MNDIPEPLSDQVFHQFLSILHYSRRYARQMQDERGIKPREFAVLRFLLETSPATVGQVQAYLHQSASTVSMLIARLEELNMLTRTRSQADQRVVEVELTVKGRELAEATPLGGLPLLRQRLGGLPEERLLEIQHVLTEIMQLMEVTESE